MAEQQSVLPTTAFERTLERLKGLPNGAHTQPTIVQDTDFYGNVSSFIVQTVRTDQGNTVFVTRVNADQPSVPMILPPKVMGVIDRQREHTSLLVKRRHGKRLAAQALASGRPNPLLNPEVRKRALAARKAKAAKRRARRKTS